MRSIEWSEWPTLPDVSIGGVTFYNVRTATYWGGEYVQFLIAHGDFIQNDSAPVVMSRKAWDELVAGAAKEAA